MGGKRHMDCHPILQSFAVQHLGAVGLVVGALNSMVLMFI